MKKFLLIAVAAMGLLFTACSKDEVAQPVVGGEESIATFTVEAPVMATRAHGDGLTATDLTVLVYQRGGDLLFEKEAEMDGLKATVELPFVNGMEYDLVFWAEAENSPYKLNKANKSVTYTNVNALVGNSEDYDAFYAYVNDIPEITGPVTKTVVLKRPFAQLNIKTNDAKKAAQSGLTVENVAVTVKKGYTAFDFVSGNGIEQGNVTFGSVAKQSEADAEGVQLLAVNYLFTGGEKSLVDVEFTYTDGDLAKGGDASGSMEFASVPVQRNYRTNIVGSLLTSDGEFDVEINPDFNEPENTVSDKVATAEELLNAVAAGLDNITLTADITAGATIEIPEGVEVILHLNGKTLSGVIAKADGPILKNKGTLTIKGGTISSTAKNGGSAIQNNAGAELTINDVTINGAEFEAPGWPSYGINNYGTLTINDADITTYHGAVATGGDGVTVINDATVDVGNSTETNQTSWALYVYDNGQLTVNGGTFANTKNEYGQVYGGGYICTSSTNQTIINGGTFDKTEGDNNGTGFYYNNKNLVIKGGTFDADPSSQNGVNYVAAGYIAVAQTDGTYKVEPIIKEGVSEIELGDAYPYATIVVDGDITIKGDTQVKTITSTNGGTITIEDGKTLTLNNFSFGSGSNPGKTYKIEGGTVEAKYGFFQHGTYELHSDFETGYMYYSFGSDITVYGTFHSKGEGDGLDYVRGNLTIAAGGKSIHDKTLWVGQPASWGAMSASLTIEPGGYVQATTLKVYGGSTLTYTNAADLDATTTAVDGGIITKL